MECEKIEQWAEGLLTVAVVAKEGEEHDVWLLLRHLFVAVKMHDGLQPEEKKKVQQVIKMTKGMFFSKFSVKETKKKKREIEKNTPIPSRKEKEEKEKDNEKILNQEKRNFSLDYEQRKEDFHQQCLSYRSRYNDSLLADFYNYWSETSRSRDKMRFECQKYWNLEKRLARWAKNHFSADNEAAAIRLDETKKKQSKETKSMEKQQVVAAVRIAADEKREAETAKAKAASVSLEEYLKTHPDSNLKMFKKK